jgi:hypothetical protein
MRAHQQNDRLIGRNQQTQSWAAPLPDFTMLPRANEANRLRVEWEPRDTANNRYWSQIQSIGPTAVTATMIREHPTAGAEPFMPSSARQDTRPWGSGAAYFPDSKQVAQRPTLPPQSLWQNAYLDGVDVEDQNVTREVRGSVRETQRGRDAGIMTRIADRSFAHQWAPPSLPPTLDQMRPERDDYRVDYMGGGGGGR